MSEGDRLPDKLSWRQLHRCCTIGGRVGHRKNGQRVKCPSRVSGTNKRWTTLAAYDWYLAQLNGEG